MPERGASADTHSHAPPVSSAPLTHAPGAGKALYVVLSIDVEEEGLFGGNYNASAEVRNVNWLKKLIPLLQRQKFPVTLLCAYSVFKDATACRTLDTLRKQCKVEIGAHLHHWSTPPLEPGLRSEKYRSASDVAEEVMEAKLRALFDLGQRYAAHPLTSFRMGRWDLHRSLWPQLAHCGVLTDSSVRPLHCGSGRPSPTATMPDHFAAPPHPYRVHIPLNGGTHEIFEAPLTCVPLLPQALPLLRHLPRALRAKVQKCGALATLPVYHPLWALRWIAKTQLAQGQRVLHLTWHSSEMMPGGAPHIPDEAAVNTLLQRIETWLLWLRDYWREQGPPGAYVRGVTLNELRQTCIAAPVLPLPAQQNTDSPQPRKADSADWTY